MCARVIRNQNMMPPMAPPTRRLAFTLLVLGCQASCRSASRGSPSASTTAPPPAPPAALSPPAPSPSPITPAPPAPPTPPEPAPSPTAPAPRPRPQTKQACAACGGLWGRHGLSPTEGCICKTKDGGRACRDGAECEGQCLVGDDSKF